MGLTVRRNPIFYNMSQSHSVISSTVVDVLRHAVGAALLSACAGEESRRRKRPDHVTWVRYGHRLYVRSVSEHILFWRPCGTDLPRMGKKYLLKPTFEETKPLFLNLLLTLSDLWHYVTLRENGRKICYHVGRSFSDSTSTRIFSRLITILYDSSIIIISAILRMRLLIVT